MNLIIVESPTKAKTLSKFLGKDYEIEATMGHIKDLPKSTLGVDVEKDFSPEYLLVEKKKDVIEGLKSKAKSSKQIFLATDPDREGEAIAAHAAEILSDKDIRISSDRLSRIVFHEITKEAIEEALAHPRAIDKNMVDAQIARRVLDRLVGYKLSPLLWKKIRRGLSAGRVQSVAVRLIVQREEEIKKFKPDEYWEIFCDVAAKSESFRVQLIKIGEKKAEIKNGDEAKKVVGNLEKSDYKVLEVKKREVRKNPFPPFTTSTMTQAGANLHGWSAKKTMSVAQKLYEEGWITYHRTDSTNIAKSALTKVRDYIKTNYGENYLPESARIYKTKSKVAQEAHEAIRPTDLKSKYESKGSKFAGESQKLYDLVWRRFVACQMAASIYDETTIDVIATLHATSYLLRASGQIMNFEGWRKVVPSKLDTIKVVQLPEVVKDEPLQLIKVDSQQKFTVPPARYNEASLIKTLEKLGIGRPSTYAPIISTIQLRQYVEKTEGRFYPTPVGFAVNTFLFKNFPEIVDYGFTAEMEGDLDKVANGEKEWRGQIRAFYKPFASKLTDVEKNSKRVAIETEKLNKKCPKCKKGELVIRIGRFGKFISCSLFPECDYKEKYIQKVGMKCPKCKDGDVIVKKTGKGRLFFGCSRYPDCDFASWKNPRLAVGQAKLKEEKGEA